MIGRILTAGFVTAVLLVIYLLINLVHLVWTYANPEGFWSFQYFIDLLRSALFVIILVVFSLAFLGYFFWSIYQTVLSFFKAEIKRPNLLAVFGIGVGYLLVMVINWVWIMGFSFYFNKNMADKFSYLNESEQLIDEGKYDEALEYAINSYNKVLEGKRKVNGFFVLSNLYLSSDWAIEANLTNEYGATINYAYCLQKTLKSVDKSEQLYLKALDLANSKVFKEDDSYKLIPMSSLAELYLAQGRYEEADAYFNSLLKISSQLSGDEIFYTLSSQMQFATYARKVGDVKKAAELQIGALDLWNNSERSKKSSTYLLLLMGAASGEMELGKLNKAGALIATAKELAEKREDKEIYLSYLQLKGTYCMLAANEGEGNEEVIENSFFEGIINYFSSELSIKERFAREALGCYQLLVEETESRFGENSLAHAGALTWLAILNSQYSNISESQKLYSQALNILEKSKDSNQQNYHSTLLYSAVANYYANQHNGLDKSIKQIEDYHFRKLSSNYLFLTEEEREMYVAETESMIRMLNSIYTKTSQKDAKQRLYNNVLATKSIALFSNQHIRKFVSNGQEKLYNEYRQVIKEKDNLDVVRQTTNSDLIADKEAKLKLDEKDILQRIKSNPSFEVFSPRAVQWTDIRSSLENNETAIEIINVPANPYAKDSIEYFALVTKRTYAQPELVPLFLESDLLKLLNQPGNTEVRINNIYSKNRKELYTKIWSPIEAFLQGSSKVYVSVSGILHKVSLPALLLDYPTEVVYLSSTRQITSLGDTKVENKIAALFGDVDYNYSIEAANVPGKRFVSNTVSQTKGGNSYERLAYTADEIKSIERVLKQNTRNNVSSYSKSNASEEALRRLSKSSVNLLHIASHGFYFSSATSMAVSKLIKPSDVAFQYEGNPLKRSGLVLAGANHSSKQNLHNDGVVTAQEISQLDLSNIDLVVLSACETGLGDIKGSEGVYGLQRAFKLAGAKSTLVSLWKVPDLQTSELMTYFYQYLETGLSKSEALKQAQIRIKSQYDLPFYWAGFILVEA